jgi:choline dehydrogenase-like flavoprotein
VRPSLTSHDNALIGYDLSDTELQNLSIGLRPARFAAAGGRRTRVHPAVWGVPAIRTEREAVPWLDERLPGSALPLVTCTLSRPARSASAGTLRRRLMGARAWILNLYLNDASMLPNSPGVNPQGMAFARPNARRYAEAKAEV